MTRCQICKRSLDEENDCTNGLRFCQLHCPCTKAPDGLCHEPLMTEKEWLNGGYKEQNRSRKLIKG